MDILGKILVQPRNFINDVTATSLFFAEKILQWLRPRDLALLSLTCKTFNFVIRSYVNHECERTNLLIQLWRFFDENNTLLLPKEIAISEAMKLNLKPELLLFSTGRQYLGKKLCAFYVEFAMKNTYFLRLLTRTAKFETTTMNR